LGILKGKADYAIKDDFKLTDEEFLGNDDAFSSVKDDEI